MAMVNRRGRVFGCWLKVPSRRGLSHAGKAPPLLGPLIFCVYFRALFTLSLCTLYTPHTLRICWLWSLLSLLLGHANHVRWRGSLLGARPRHPWHVECFLGKIRLFGRGTDCQFVYYSFFFLHGRDVKKSIYRYIDYFNKSHIYIGIFFAQVSNYRYFF